MIGLAEISEYHSLLITKMTQLSGYCAPEFRELEKLFGDLWQGIEVGAAVSVFWRGEPVVNLWGGHLNRARTLDWNEHTLVNTYSITKGVMAVAIAKAVESGMLDYNTPVAKYWPEFAAGNKQDITVSTLLSHQAGLCGVETKLSVSDLCNWSKMTSLLAQQSPLWTPGEAAGYHAVTWGYLAGELIKRVTNMSPGQYIQKEICGLLNLDFHLGVPEHRLQDCAEMIGPNHARGLDSQERKIQDPATQTPSERKRLFELAQLNPVISPYKHASSREWRLAEIPASNGHSNAFSLAKLYSALANGGELDGVRILKEQSVEQARQVAVADMSDLVMNQLIRRSQAGFILSHEDNYGQGLLSFGHAGAGGSMAFADPEANIGFADVMNQLQPEGYGHRYRKMLEKVYEIITDLANFSHIS